MVCSSGLILMFDTQDLQTASFPSFHTHLPNGPSTRVCRRWPRVETGHILSGIGRGEAHALIGGELARSLAIKSSGGNRQLQKQRPKMNGSTEGMSAATSLEREGEKQGKRVNFAGDGRRGNKVMWRTCGVIKEIIRRKRCHQNGSQEDMNKKKTSSVLKQKEKQQSKTKTKNSVVQNFLKQPFPNILCHTPPLISWQC